MFLGAFPFYGETTETRGNRCNTAVVERMGESLQLSLSFSLVAFKWLFVKEFNHTCMSVSV